MVKKKLFAVLASCVMVLCSGCGAKGDEEVLYANDSYFTKINEWKTEDGCTYSVVYANDTKVKYLIISNSYRYGITPLYTEEGEIQIFQ